MDRFMDDRVTYVPQFQLYEPRNQGLKPNGAKVFPRACDEHLPDMYPRHPSPGGSHSSRSSGYHSDEIYGPQSGYGPTPPYSMGSPNDFSQQSLPYPELGGGSSVALRDVQQFQDEQPEQIVPTMERDDLRIVYENHSYEADEEFARTQYEQQWVTPDDDSCRDADGESVHPCSTDDASDSEYSPQVTTSPKVRRHIPRRISHPNATSPNRTTPRRTSGSGTRSHGRNSSTSSSGGVVNGKIKKRAHTRSSSNAGHQRSFPCLLHSYKCDSTFATKNEWKRHINTQHLRLGFWRCDHCSTSPNEDGSMISYNDFNRKDLFTQHLRRMHFPEAQQSPNKKGSTPKSENSENGVAVADEAEAQIAKSQVRCYIEQRLPPSQSRCVFSFCKKTFEGAKNWDERLEHVGRHLEGMSKGKEGNEKDGMRPEEMWVEDQELRRWLEDEGLIEGDGKGGWRVGDGVPVRDQDGN
ncbi:hypothetical protein P152DRAFT_470011 [Eremomyces bilateralis CBS 781.70]|uniref:C2H2-type domain-containing protein n=1 Tax=Eremomyces bilateralis CBS 781.70 TaxID=1392243 RepID=A0A6G1GIC0_9PEZI|nr:uncharacterized protein P152DRAFT_470011 [Eremomyces bilateralis CBS 781.70]KAF1817610.1 hypothetical protein P152DRAFT_470011 [Eremomyces bilateralis CBS 781.70]